VGFLLSELRDIPAVRAYRLRTSGFLAEVRHPLLDMWVLEEVFRLRVYEPPPPVRAAIEKLARPIRILDLGGHVGFFGLFALSRYPDASITSFEPDERNAAVLRRCIEANGLTERWEVIEACAGVSDGRQTFQSSFHLSRAAPADEGALQELHRRVGRVFTFLEETPLLRADTCEVAVRDVFPFLARADLVKIDIEGGEWELLADPRLRDIAAAAIVLEYHPDYSPGPDASAAVARHLAAAGFRTSPIATTGEAAMLWAWRIPAETS